MDYKGDGNPANLNDVGLARDFKFRAFEWVDQVRMVPQKYLNAYPWASCRPSHHCFNDQEDLVISFITLSSYSKNFAFSLLNKFLRQSIASYEGIVSDSNRLAKVRGYRPMLSDGSGRPNVVADAMEVYPKELREVWGVES